jgi:capsule polysaccharide export protein KpsE/RkpR
MFDFVFHTLKNNFKKVLQSLIDEFNLASLEARMFPDIEPLLRIGTDMKTNEISATKTADLIAFYNKNVPAEKAVAKFTNRATAEKRIAALVASLQEKTAAKVKAAATVEQLPAKPAKPANVKAAAKTAAPKSAELETAIEALKASAEAAVKVRKSNAAGISASWADPEVRDARLTRQGVAVVVGGKASQYNSTKAAFEALGLPISKHIRFRMKLKEAGKLAFEHDGKSYAFAIL